MTLLVNEIHVREHLQKGLIILAADRRITVKGAFHSNRKKLFEIPYLNAGVGYFGLAQVNQTEFLSSWLPNFIGRTCDATGLEEFSNRLCDDLNRTVNKRLLAKEPSGFHICGYNNDNYPELWFIRSFLRMEGDIYKGLQTEYCISEDFLARDAREQGFNGADPGVSNSFIQYYVNGDTRAFHSVWLRLDDFLAEMFSYADFKHSRQASDLEMIAKWKMGVISSFYGQFAEKRIIGTPIDACVLLPKKVGWKRSGLHTLPATTERASRTGPGRQRVCNWDSDRDTMQMWHRMPQEPAKVDSVYSHI